MVGWTLFLAIAGEKNVGWDEKRLGLIVRDINIITTKHNLHELRNIIKYKKHIHGPEKHCD